ncbi:MAG: class I SAM-dependent methyltransferase [Methanomicrobia archaeon]|nr:class I SAM-dependent methyltransferase [Methanomicrobia archaeon]
MTTEVQEELRKDRFRANLLSYTRRAFRMLPALVHPTILDIGCGTGVPTLKLARLSNGTVLGLDINQPALDDLQRRIVAANLSDRVKAVHGSLFELEFPDESFDILWAEGSIAVIGFEQGLEAWQRLLKHGGFLVIHDEIGEVERKLNSIIKSGYKLLGHFYVSADEWWRAYYEPLERRIAELRAKYRDNAKALAVLDDEYREVALCKRNPERCASVFFVMQKEAVRQSLTRP